MSLTRPIHPLRRRLAALVSAAALGLAGLVMTAGSAHADANVQVAGPASEPVNTDYVYNVTFSGNIDQFILAVDLTGAPATFTGYDGACVPSASNRHLDCDGFGGGPGSGSGDFVLPFDVVATAAGTVTFTVALSGDLTGTASATTIITPPPAADLSVALAADGDPGLLTGHIAYTETITNQGPAALTSATITAPLPTPMTATSSDCTVGTGSGPTVTCTIGALAAGTSTTRHFTVPIGLLTLGLPYTVTATRTASTPADPNPANDSATRSCTVITSLIISCT